MTSERDSENHAPSDPDQGTPDERRDPRPRSLESEWDDAPTDPDPERDLGYEWIQFEVFGEAEDADQFMVLPTDRQLLKEDAFVVVDPGHVEDLDDWA